MNYLLNLLSPFALFMLSQWGWWCFFSKHSSIHRLFLPSLTACFQITALVCFGMVGKLLPGTYALLLFGTGYLLYAFLRKYRPLQSLSCIGLVFLLCTMAVIYLAAKGKVVFVHDNFAHWATLVKELFRTNYFPSSSHLLTEHFTYPLGSAVWIYFFSLLIGPDSESIWMCGQALLMLYCILPLFCFLPNHASPVFKGIFLLFTILLTNCFLFYNIRVTNLMVDTLLPLVGAAASIFAYSTDKPQPFSMEGDSRIGYRNTWLLLPYLSTLIQIKTSGLFFAVAAVVILLLKPSVHSDKKRLVQVGAVFALSLVPLLFWRVYCSFNYAGMTAKHDGSLSSFFTILSKKSADNISTIVFQSLKYFFTSRYTIEFFIVLTVVFLLVMFISSDAHFYIAAKAWGLLIVVYLLYAFMTTAMYIFSMPLNEALELATIDRYQKTILIYGYYIIACTILFSIANVDFILVRGNAQLTKKTEIHPAFDSLDNHYAPLTIVRISKLRCPPAIPSASRILSLACVLILLLIGWMSRYNWRFSTIFDDYSGFYLVPRIQLESSLKAANVPDRSKCYVLTTKDKRVYVAMLALLLGTDRRDTTQVVIDSPEQLQAADDALINGAWVIVVDTENRYIQTWLKQKNDSHIVIVQ